MKISFLGNINNYPLMLALAMKDLGHEVVLVIDRPEPLHRPENYTDSQTLKDIKIIDCTGAFQKFYHYLKFPLKVQELIVQIKDSDIIIASGLWPILARSLKIPFIVLLTGSDLEIYANPPFMVKDYWGQTQDNIFIKRIVKVFIAWLVSIKMFKSLKKAVAYNYFAKGLIPNGDKILNKLPRHNPYRLCFMMTDTKRLQPVPVNRDTKKIKVLLAARHNWVLPIRPTNTELDYKGTDIFLKGVALFLKNHPDQLEVVLIRKGYDVEMSMQLIKELDIETCITWKDEMTQKELFQEYLGADIIADQFSKSVVAMAGLDAMAMGKPLLANARPEIFRDIIGVDSPICHATNPEEVCAQLIKLLSADVRESVSSNSRKYVEKYFSSSAAAEKCLAVIK